MLEVKAISKMYSVNKGVKDITFSIDSGEAVALIGPNGSGKTTLLNIIAGVLKADGGIVCLDGLMNDKIEVRKNIGFLPDSIIINPKTRVADLLNIISDYKYKGDYKEEIDKELDAYRISDYKNARFGDLSLGTQKKVGLIIAFMGTPSLIILDEPTNGIDTNGIIRLKDNIREAKEKGSSVVISSHILDFVNTVADRSLFLKNTQLDTIVTGNENLESVYKKLYL